PKLLAADPVLGNPRHRLVVCRSLAIKGRHDVGLRPHGANPCKLSPSALASLDPDLDGQARKKCAGEPCARLSEAQRARPRMLLDPSQLPAIASGDLEPRLRRMPAVAAPSRKPRVQN